MWDKMRDFIRDDGCLFKSEELAEDLCIPEKLIDQKGRLLLESKDSMKRRGMNSPDTADALALCFAIPIQEYYEDKEYSRYRRQSSGRSKAVRDPYR